MHAVTSGLLGATALTAVHETLRRLIDAPPRMDIVGMRGLKRLYRMSGHRPPAGNQLYWMTLAGDIVSNAAYYAAVNAGSRRAAWNRATVLGLAAGIGAVTLPQRLGLGTPPNNHRLRTRVLTVAYYLTGALVAAAAARRRR